MSASRVKMASCNDDFDAAVATAGVSKGDGPRPGKRKGRWTDKWAHQESSVHLARSLAPRGSAASARLNSSAPRVLTVLKAGWNQIMGEAGVSGEARNNTE